MNCCDYDCNQGEDCPARACPHCRGMGYDSSGLACTCSHPAKVARARRAMHACEPLPQSHWRQLVKAAACYMLGAIGLLLYAALLSAALS